jgi:hypothetical protein
MIDMTENDFANDIEPDALREAEMLQAREILHDLVGQSVVDVQVEDTRISVVAQDGARYFFYGFMGASLPGEDDDS